MKIVRHGRGLNLKCAHHVVERLAEEVEAGEIFEIAEVLALVDESAARERKDILEMTADGEQRRRVNSGTPMRAKRRAEQIHVRGE